MEINGVLEFFSETGTEGGIWALYDDSNDKPQPVKYGVSQGKVYDKYNVNREGEIIKSSPCFILKDGKWLPWPDPLSRDSDYVISSLFCGKNLGDRDADKRLMEKYGFKMTYRDDDLGGTPRTEPMRPYGACINDLMQVEVEWSDGKIEKCFSDSLLVKYRDYKNLHYIKNNDFLVIYDKQDENKVIFEGLIDLEEIGLFTEDAFGMWLRTGPQKGINKEIWARWFLDENPASLFKATDA